ncbi:hypothetical protein ACHAWF_006119, partial [Thalassiosira exigua]
RGGIRPRPSPSSSSSPSALNLVPLSEAWDAGLGDDAGRFEPFASLVPSLGCPSLNSEGMLIRTVAGGGGDDDGEMYNERHRLYLATDEDDLPPVAQLTIDVFDASAIVLSSATDWTALEKAVVGAVVEPAIGVYNAYAQAVGYTEVLSGLRRRMRNRISERGESEWLAPLIAPNDEWSSREGASTEAVAARSSLILALARPAGPDGELEAVASVELRLQPPDAKIPFSQPWLDVLERRLTRLLPFARGKKSRDDVAPSESDENTPLLRPYLCNLCVSPALRSLGIGRALCRIVESVAFERWGYDRIYLHVDPSNDAARRLYETEGYKDAGRRWDAVWAGGASDVGYYVKRSG